MPKKPNCSKIFPMGAVCDECGKEADSFDQLQTEHWSVPYATDDNGDWTGETPAAFCPTCAGRWEGIALTTE